MKTIMKGTQSRLCELFLHNSYCERRNPNCFKFYCKANLRIGRQAISKQTAALLNEVDFDWKLGMTDDLLRKKRKVHFKMAKEVAFSTGLGYQIARTLKSPVFPPQNLLGS